MGYLALIFLGFNALCIQLCCRGFDPGLPPSLASRTCSADNFMMTDTVLRTVDESKAGREVLSGRLTVSETPRRAKEAGEED